MKQIYKIFYFLLLTSSLLIIPMAMKATHMFKSHHNENALYADYAPPVLGAQLMDTLEQPLAFRFVNNYDEEQEKPRVNMYPNPTRGEFTLEINDDKWRGGTVGVYNLLGQEIMQEPITLGQSQYDITSASKGVYFLTLQNGNLKKTLRFMKQ